ncbi:sigma-70 family RNA polymerase sigma factor [Paenarthrobacter sp. PH39-S1]|uniref:RNA polymerase sigma factor n=1 Tax=Paenarthrobacter sp. PH39-S1 TaxID=3046204 RepID=UPI0024B8F6F4|nr:sigma-70 family RNA polymerase sigma factor [Paenarthrobacter sp. PH39-S1]MDJ0356666.1 sigma-70 family RNA polymerase sigma factor [Paenarthrobacter sp. PH39-S1]
MSWQHEDVRSVVAAASAAESVRIIATLIRVTGDWALAEDCVQDAFARALSDWPRRGIPANPVAWLTTVAKNRAIDQLRRSASESHALRRLAFDAEFEGSGNVADAGALVADAGALDDRLRLIFTCCHPALALEARVALTLRTVAGLTTAEIARAFLVPEATMAKRLVRARAKIRNAGIPYRVPPLELLPERTGGVLAVLYLLFNEGYSASGSDQLIRQPLVREAIRLARMLVELMDATPLAAEARALLSLMLMQHARSTARIDTAGDLVTLEEQDRRLWDRTAIAESAAVLRVAEQRRIAGKQGPGSYQLQAQIAACHMDAPDVAGTDFARLVRLYDALAAVAPSPVVELNRAVAVAMSQGPEAGLELVDRLDDAGVLKGYYLLPAARADLLRRLGRGTDAADYYRRARDLAPSDVERRYLSRRLAETGKPTTPAGPTRNPQ